MLFKSWKNNVFKKKFKIIQIRQSIFLRKEEKKKTTFSSRRMPLQSLSSIRLVTWPSDRAGQSLSCLISLRCISGYFWTFLILFFSLIQRKNITGISGMLLFFPSIFPLYIYPHFFTFLYLDITSSIFFLNVFFLFILCSLTVYF